MKLIRESQPLNFYTSLEMSPQPSFPRVFQWWPQISTIAQQKSHLMTSFGE